MVAPQRCAIVECVSRRRIEFYVNLMQLQEFPQNAMFRLKCCHFIMGSVKNIPFKHITFWGSLSKMWPTSYRTELDVPLYHNEKQSFIWFRLILSDMLLAKLLLQNIGKGNNSVYTCDGATVLTLTLCMIALYQCIKFHLIPFNNLRDNLRTSLLLSKLGRKVSQ